MLLYCLKCRGNTKSKNPKVVRIKHGRRMLLWKCAVCNSKKSKFLKEQEAKGALSNLLGKKELILNKHTWVTLLKDKKGITITSDFQKMLDESNRKSNKTWADKGSEFYNRSMKSLLQNNDMEMHSQHNEGKSVVVEDSLEP